MMQYVENITSLVGNTPLIKLRQVSEDTGCNILGKAEFLNPGQSVKDRAALWIIRDAINKGLIEKGGLIVEGSAGNTGIGLTVIGQALGFKTLIVIFVFDVGCPFVFSPKEFGVDIFIPLSEMCSNIDCLTFIFLVRLYGFIRKSS